MKIICPGCCKHVEPKTVLENYTTFKCPKCKTTWFLRLYENRPKYTKQICQTGGDWDEPI